MAGLGYRTWTAGEKARSVNIQGYLMDQTVMVFATTTTRDAAISSPSEGMVAYITTGDKFTFYNGVTWVDLLYPGQYSTSTWSPQLWLDTTEQTNFVTTAARVVRTGRMVHAMATLTLNGAFTGTGTLNASLPFARASDWSTVTLGTARLLDSPSTNYYRFAVARSANASRINFGAEAGTLVTGTNVFIWASGDVLEFNVLYEASA